MTKETITLNHPFKHDGVLISEVTLRRPTVRDMERSQRHKDDFQKSLHMIADLAELAPDAVRELDTEDFTRIGDRVGEYMGVSED